MVNYCVCGGCTNSSLSGHRVHRFPNKKKDGAIFCAWVRFVQAKRRDFTSESASKNAVVCSVHFRPEDYHPGDIMEFNMGCRSKNQVRLRAGAVPSVYTTPGSAGGRRYYGHRSARDAARRKRKLCADLGDIASNEGGDASTASSAVLADPEQEAFSPLAPQSSVLHLGSQCNLRPSHRSSVFPQPTTPGTGKQSKKRKTVLQTATTKKRLDQQRAQTRVNIGVAFPRWRQLRDSKGLKSDAMVAVFLLDSYEKTAASTALVHGLPKPLPPPHVSTNISDRKVQEMKPEGFGPWSSVSLKLEQVQKDGDGNDSSSFSVDIIQVKQEDPVHVKQEDPVQMKQEDTGESEFWCSASMQQDPEMSGGVDASHQVSLHFNKLKEADHYCGNGESLPSEDLVQTLKSEDLKTEEPIEEQSMDRKDHIKVCFSSISNQATHMQTIMQICKVSSPSTQTASTISELTMKIREELQVQIAVLQNRIRAIICTKFPQHSACTPQSDLDYEKLLKGFYRNFLSKNPLCKASGNTTQKINHVRHFILHMAKGYPPVKTVPFLDNMKRINESVVTLQNRNMNVRHYLLDLLAFLMFLNRTSGPNTHLTRHSRKHIRRQLRQKLKDIYTLKIPQMDTQGLWRRSLYTKTACKQVHFMKAGLCLTACDAGYKNVESVVVDFYIQTAV